MIEFRFPDVGEGIVEGEIVRWLVAEGESVAEHQPLVEMETDKAVVEIPSPCAGRLREQRGKPGTVVAVGDVLAVIEERAETAPPRQPFAAGVVGELEEAPEAEPAVATQEAPKILPRERKLAEELGIDLRRVAGSGPQGRITEDDLRTAVGEGAETADRLPLQGVRRTMARAMAISAATAVPATIMASADALALRQLKERERALAAQRGLRLSWLCFLLKALTLVLERFPLLNSSLDAEKQEIVLHRTLHIGVAVDTPDGLLVPVVRNARRLSIFDLAAVLQDFSQRARERRLTPAELKGGTFTVSNYGAVGGMWGTPIINPPEAAILGIGRIEEAAVVRDGQVTARPLIPLSLSFDHRIIDGATAQRFLNALVEHLENPDIILLEN